MWWSKLTELKRLIMLTFTGSKIITGYLARTDGPHIASEPLVRTDLASREKSVEKVSRT